MKYALSYINIHIHVSVNFATTVRVLHKNTDPQKPFILHANFKCWELLYHCNFALSSLVVKRALFEPSMNVNLKQIAFRVCAAFSMWISEIRQEQVAKFIKEITPCKLHTLIIISHCNMFMKPIYLQCSDTYIWGSNLQTWRLTTK